MIPVNSAIRIRLNQIRQCLFQGLSTEVPEVPCFLELGNLIADKEMSIWLVFFDGEDQGKINNWQWSIGAEYFANNLVEKPEKVVILDMLGDQDLKIYKELNSDHGIIK